MRLRPLCVKREQKKKVAGQTPGRTLTCAEQRGKRGQRSNQREHSMYYVQWSTTVGNVQFFWERILSDEGA